ncbi:hypothetical protein LTR28_002199 [Elasticomyces elasticus]|nr:hypothetical protein LTR28_002199 [Elasticomyces elasticus]
MGHLAVVSSIWGDVSAFLHRSVHRAPSHYAEAYDQFYKQTHRRLDEWMSRLPAHLHHTQQNTERSIREGYAGTLISLFALHHITLMKLNRIARHALLPRATVAHNIRAAHHHALKFLHVLRTLHLARAAPNADDEQHNAARASSFAFSTPFPGYAALSAIDILGAGGPLAELDAAARAIADGLAALRELSAHWASARAQFKAARKRHLQIQAVVTEPQSGRFGLTDRRVWGIQEPLERVFGREEDCVYGVESEVYFEALGAGVE